MSAQTAERHEQCTVIAEYNAYGAMTVQSSRGKTYQIVGAASQRVAQQLAALTHNDETTVSLRQAPGRGNTWHAVAVGTASPPEPPR
ncbi:hypothetical protein DM826_06925 [Halonotius aquaticus]|uniref:DUF7999 domain-containing protein n=1 Tax=Halonotius aquaticus TaxID=2216978 RepID=A0A3A6PYL0_9EURY|nr:hypothetical protein [Halonotius aquaticus]RJX43333.1 hypothetical protein DM826_06925 [Halonotius aquaticus]